MPANHAILLVEDNEDDFRPSGSSSRRPTD